MLRSTSAYIAAAAGEREILTDAVRGGLRRARTGPDHTGSRRLQAYLRTCGGSLSEAQDRAVWQQYQDGWVLSFGCSVTVPCVRQVREDLYMWEPRCLQGVLRGSQSFYWSEAGLSELRQREGWVIQRMPAEADSQTYLDATLSRCSSHTLHIRIFSKFHISVSTDFLQSLSLRSMVMEWSFHGAAVEGSLPFGCEAWLAAHSA